MNSLIERKLPKGIEDKIEDVDILTDFDGTMIKEESQYMEVVAYFFCKPHEHIKFTKEVLSAYQDYKKNDNVQAFYSLFKGCPVEVLDKVTQWISQNKKWNKLIESLHPKKVGIVSRNNQRLILKYLNRLDYQPSQISLIAANIPEISGESYTGNTEIIVDNKNLIDFIRKRDFICDFEEKDILEKLGVYPKKINSGLYICERRKIF